MTDRLDEFTTWADQALAEYDLASPTIDYIGHSDNVTFRVTDAATRARFLLRLHYPITSHFLGVRQEPQAIASELEWLEALGRDTSIVVPRPVHNRRGELVTPITLADGAVVQSTLLHWIDGEHLRMDAPEVSPQILQLGQICADLHEHARHWTLPRDFLRPVYGKDFIEQIVERIERGVTSGVVSESDSARIAETVRRAGDELTKLGQGTAHWGLIHNDLHPGNCLVHDSVVSPIDFSLCGFGYYPFDIGSSLGSMPTNLRQSFLDGYAHCRALPANHVHLIEGSLLISRMSYYALVLPDSSHQAWIQSRIPQVVATLCTRWLAGESFLFELR